MRRMGGSSGFPALASTITDINCIVSSELDSVSKLSRAILRDVSLTNKLLQVVNSSVYGQFKGHIHTISKAVLILGFEAVRNAAMSLIMLKFSQGKSQAQRMQDEIVGAFFAGVVSKSICAKLGPHNGEEAVICTMFQNLGRMLSIFFLYEDSRAIGALVADGMSEERASKEVLGISYQDLGVGAARRWNFPERLVQGMQKNTAREPRPPKNEAERLNIAASMANEVCAIAKHGTDKEKQTALDALARRYKSAIKINSDELLDAVRTGLDEIAERALPLNIAVGDSPMLTHIKTWAGALDQPVDDTQVTAPTDEPLLQQVAALEAVGNTTETPLAAEHILSSGIRDVTETLAGEFSLNDILQMLLEIMYRGMGFSRTLIFINDARQGVMRARFGFGKDIEQLLPKCAFPTAPAPDVFHVALDKGVDIVINDALAPNIASRIPQWYQQAMTAKSFLLLPVMVKNKAIGLFYADSQSPAGITITPEQLELLRTLRSQAVLAIKQKT